MKKPWPKEDDKKIDRLEKEGHTLHCSCRQVWGDGECTCNKSGTSLSKRMEKIVKLIRKEKS